MSHGVKGLAGEPVERRPIPNVFYVILVLISTLFVVTALAYLMGPYVVQKAAADPTQGSIAVAFTDWLERHGPWILGAEFVTMLVAGTLAMVLDPWFTHNRSGTEHRRGGRS